MSSVQEALKHAFRQTLSVSFLNQDIEAIEDFGRGLAEAVEQLPDYQVFEYEMGLEARRRPEMLAELRAVYEEYVTLVERQLRAVGIDRPRSFSRLVLASLDGLVLQQVFFGRPEEARKGMEELHELLRLAAGSKTRPGR